MTQLSVIEIAVRELIAHEHGRRYGEKAFYLDTEFYEHGTYAENDKPLDVVSGIVSDLSRGKSNIVSRYADKSVTKSDFDNKIRRYANVPIWVAVEVISFGRVSNMLPYAKDLEPANAAAEFLGVQWAPFSEVIHSLSVLRNLYAHHRQLWNSRMGILLSSPEKTQAKKRQVPSDKRI